MNNTQYENIIVLLKKALEFYADEDNYVQKAVGSELVTRIEMDNGYQARFAIDNINKLKEFDEKIFIEYTNELQGSLKTEISGEELLNMLNLFKTKLT